MALDYDKLRLTAERLIGENGRPMTLVRMDQGNPLNPSKPWRGSTDAEEVTISVVGVFTEYEKEDFDGSLVRRGDKRVLAAAKDIDDVSSGSAVTKIEDFDYLLDGSVRWKVITVDTIEPGPLRILYDLQVRQ